MLEIAVSSEEETSALGRRLGELVRPGDVVGLSGPLGAGKTVLVRGLAQGLGCDPERVRSPSFTLMVTYEGGRLPLHHLDLYRMQPTEEDRLALREFLYGQAVCAVGWYERLGEECEHLAVEIDFGEHRPMGAVLTANEVPSPSHGRRIRLRASGGRSVALIEAVRSAWR